MILTIAGADFSGANIGTNTTVKVTYNSSVTNQTQNIERGKDFNVTITLKTDYTYNSLSITVGGSEITGYTATDNGNGTVSLSIPGNLITGAVSITVNATYNGSGEAEPEEPGTGGGTEKTYGTLISDPSNLRGGVVDAIAVRPPFYEDIIGKKITKVNVYKVVDSSDSSKTNIQMGKIKLSSFDCSKITVSTFNNAVSNIESVQSYNVSSMGDVLDLTCDITLNDGEYLCFVVKNGHCVGYCNNNPDRLSMMYVYQNKIAPSVGSELSQQVPITVTVLNN